MILFTADLDWASEEVLNFFFDSISKFEAKWIFFATNSNDRFHELEKNGHIIGIHPNFIPCTSRFDMEEEVSRMKDIFPDANFSRSHSLMTGGPIWDSLQKNGITHDFSWFQPIKEMPRNRTLWNGLKQVGFNWEDDYHFHSTDFKLRNQRMIETSQNLIVNFHPIHFFLNTSKREDYKFYLQNRDNSSRIAEFSRVNWSNELGCGRLLINLLENRDDAVNGSFNDFISNLCYEQYPWVE